MNPHLTPPFAAARKNWLWLTAVYTDRLNGRWIIQSDDVSTSRHYYRFVVCTRHAGTRHRLVETMF